MEAILGVEEAGEWEKILTWRTEGLQRARRHGFERSSHGSLNLNACGNGSIDDPSAARWQQMPFWLCFIS